MSSRRNKIAVPVAVLTVLGAAACSAPSKRASTPTSSSISSSSTTPTTLPSSSATLAVTPTTISPPGRVGDAVFLPGVDGTPPAQVTLVKIIDPARGADQFAAPVGSSRLVGVKLRITYGGTNPVPLDPGSATTLEDAQNNLYQPIAANIVNCPAFKPGRILPPGTSAGGCLTFDVDTGAKITEVLFTPNGQFGSVTAEWDLP
jgi:hypothetical protein